MELKSILDAVGAAAVVVVVVIVVVDVVVHVIFILRLHFLTG